MASSFAMARVTWSRWMRAVDWAEHEDRLREARRMRSEQDRVRLDLEAVWAMPAWTASDA